MRSTSVLRWSKWISGAVLGVLVGCGDLEVDRVGVAMSAEESGGESITVFTWMEYLDPELLEEFERRSGIKVEYEVFNTAGEMEGRLRSEPGAFDVIIVDDSIITQLRQLQLIRDLDTEKLTNLGNLAEKYRQMPFDPENEFSVPYLWGTTLIAYRQDLLGEVEHSWDLLFGEGSEEPVMLLDEPVQLYSVMFANMGSDPLSLDAQLHEEATQKVCDLVLEGEARLGGDDQVRVALEEGAVGAAMCYSSDAAMLADENDGIDYFIPNEGAPLWIDCFVISRDAPNVEGAHRFIDFMLTAEAAAASTNYTWCASPNEAAMPLIDEEILTDERIFPSRERLERCYFLPALDAERQRLTHAGFFAIENALRERAEDESAATAVGAAGKEPLQR